MVHCVGSSDVRRNVISLYICSIRFEANTYSKKNNGANDSGNNSVLFVTPLAVYVLHFRLYFVAGLLGI